MAKAKVGKWARVMRQRRQWAYNRIVSLNFINIIHVFVRARRRSGVERLGELRKKCARVNC